MTAAIHAKPEDMSRGQIEAAVKLLRVVAEAARRYRALEDSSSSSFANMREKDICRANLDNALLKVGLP